MSDSNGTHKTQSPFDDEPECPGCGRRLIHGSIHPFPPCEWRREKNRGEEDLRDAQEAAWRGQWESEPRSPTWDAFREAQVDDAIILCSLILMRVLIRQSNYQPEVQAKVIERIRALVKRYKEGDMK
jgi:hypothetical protein